MGRNRVDRNTKSAEMKQLKFRLFFILAKGNLPMLVSSCHIVYIATQHYCEPKKNKFQVTTSYSYLPNTADPQVALLGVAGGGVGVAEDNPLLILWGNH